MIDHHRVEYYFKGFDDDIDLQDLTELKFY